MAKKPATEAECEHMRKVAELGCIICEGEACVHHAETGGGGRKDHMKVIPLCLRHHQGEDGIHKIGRKAWQKKYGTEQYLLLAVKGLLLEEQGNYIL